MKRPTVNLFVKLWTEENIATRKILVLDSKIENAESSGAPTKRLRSNLSSWRKKQRQALKQIELNVSSGNFPPNAAALSKKKLGKIHGYVSDCYEVLYQDTAIKSEK